VSLPITPNQPEEVPGPLGYLVTTPNALVSLELEQQFLDDVRVLSNQASSLLTSFNGDHGTLTINWLEQLQQLDQSSGGTKGLYCLMHNPSTTPCSDAPGDSSQGGGALLDTVAVNALQKLLLAGAPNPGVTISAALQQAWAQSLQAQKAQRWSTLTLCQQAELRDAYVEQKLGNIAINYPNTIGPNTILDGLLEWRVTDISFEVDINQTEVVTALAITSPNEVQCVIDLPRVAGKAWLDTYPGPTYWIALAVDTVSCAFLGIGCELLAEAVDVGVLLALNIAYLGVNFGSPHIVVDNSLQPDQSQVMWPTPVVSITANATVSVIDAVPPNLGTIVGLIVSAVGSSTNLVPHLIAGQLKNALAGLFHDLGLRFPLAQDPVTDQFADSEASGASNDYLDAISQENPQYSQTNPSEQMITAEDQLTYRFRSLVTASSSPPAFPQQVSTEVGDRPCHLYAGFGISQNYLNLLINQLWQSNYFVFPLPATGGGGAAGLAAAVESAVPGLHLGDPAKLHAQLSPDTSPRLLLTEHDALAGRNYAVAHFDDLRLWLTDGVRGKPASRLIEFRFGAHMPAQIAFGAPSSGQIDITKANPNRTFDLYYDATTITLDPAVQSVATYGAAVATVTDAALPALQPIFTDLVAGMLVGNQAAWIPRQAGDPVTVQRFPLGGQNWIICQLNVARGNLYAQLGLGGTLLGVDIQTLTCAEAKIVLALLGG
jgi:hypothetical protein